MYQSICERPLCVKDHFFVNVEYENKCGLNSRQGLETFKSRKLNHLSVSRHLDACVQELVKVLAELSGSVSQLAAGAPGCMDHLPSGVVEVSGRLIQVALRLLEGLRTGRELGVDKSK